jgi:hypothetical protein
MNRYGIEPTEMIFPKLTETSCPAFQSSFIYHYIIKIRLIRLDVIFTKHEGTQFIQQLLSR